MPRLSVILPVRDGGDFLRESVRSILNQEFSDLELIVVDDHSSDGAAAALNFKDDRLTVLGNQGRGVSAAFNTGLASAKGELVARMDADDIALPNRFSVQLAYLDRHPEVAICGGCVELFSREGIAGGNRRYEQWLNHCRSPGRIAREIFVESPIPNPTAVFRRNVIEALGGYDDPSWPEDYDLFLRAHARGMKFGKPAPVVLRWRDHEGRLTRSDNRYDLARFQEAKAHYLARQLSASSPRIQQVVIWGAGPTGTRIHDLLAEEGIGCSGFLEVHPRRIGGEKRGRPVWPLEHLDQLTGQFVVIAVGAAGARQEIRGFMDRPGWVEGENWLFVA